MKNNAIRFLCLMKICLGANTTHNITLLTLNGQGVAMELPPNNGPEDLLKHPEFCKMLTNGVGLGNNCDLLCGTDFLNKDHFPLQDGSTIDIIRDTTNIHSLPIPIVMASGACCVLLGNFEKIKDRISELDLTLQQILYLKNGYLDNERGLIDLQILAQFKDYPENADIKQILQYSKNQLSILKEIQGSINYIIFKLGDQKYTISKDSFYFNKPFLYLLTLQNKRMPEFIQHLNMIDPSNTITEITYLVPGLD